VVAKIPAPAAQEKHLTAYLDWLAPAIGHLDRREPLRNYCMGLLLDGERKSVEPMAARLVLVAASEGAKMAAPEGATVPTVDGSGCARGLAGSALVV